MKHTETVGRDRTLPLPPTLGREADQGRWEGE
jgi:hypothetical protein